MGSRMARRLVVAATVVVCAAVASTAQAAFPGANGKIAFDSDVDGNNEIYVVNPDGTDLTRLTTNPASDTDAAWSPDGSKIVFVSDRDGSHEIYVMNADGTDQERV